MAAICDGLNVLEMGAGSVASSMAGMVLADAGARVIKIEPPDGDGLREQVPSGFLVWNRGKESLVADLRTSAGRERLRELAAVADVVIEAFAPGTTDAWGIGAGALCAANPALVHCSITGFGPTGPYAKVKSYDPLVAAKVGLFARGGFGHRDGPIHYPVPWGSYGAAMQAVAGILGALVGARADRARATAGCHDRGRARSGRLLRLDDRPADGQARRGAVDRRPYGDRRQPLRRAGRHERRAVHPDLDDAPAPGPGTDGGRRHRPRAGRSQVRQPSDVRDGRGRPGVGGSALGGVPAGGPEALAAPPRGQPRCRVRGRCDQRGGDTPSADRAQRRRDHRPGRNPWADPPGRPDRSLRRHADRGRTIGTRNSTPTTARSRRAPYPRPAAARRPNIHSPG